MRWSRALTTEIRSLAALTPGRCVETVFFGGGTPSLMAPETVDAVLSEIRAQWTLAPDTEITMEANPTSVEAGRFSAYAQAGVNRLSMGVQSLRDADLKALGRLHTAAEARAAFDIAKTYFGRVSFDLIYARQHQSPEDWKQELGEALAMAVDHLSLYQLTIEAGTRFGDLYDLGRLRGLPTDDVSADMYEITGEVCGRAGLDAYEISNHARAGSESRHNLIYWRYGDYAGIGPGAHGRLTSGGRRLATVNRAAPEDWLAVVESGLTEIEAEPISAEDQAVEYLMMSLRLSEGSDLERYARLAGMALRPGSVSELIEDGFLKRSGPRITATDKGRPVLNAVLRKLLA